MTLDPTALADIIKGLRFAASSGANRLQQTDAIDKAIDFLAALRTGAEPVAVTDEMVDRVKLAWAVAEAPYQPTADQIRLTLTAALGGDRG